MEQRMTWNWLRKYANQQKHASFQDKLNAIQREKNPYYLVEWLVLPVPAYVYEEITFSRTPGMVKNSYIPFTEAFFHQLLFELIFASGANDPAADVLIQTAIRDLLCIHGEQPWRDGASECKNRLEEGIRQYRLFMLRLEQEEVRLNNEFEKRWHEIGRQQDTDELERGDLQKSVKDAFRHKIDEAPRKLLHKHFSGCPLVSYLHYREWGSNPADNKLEHFFQRLSFEGYGIYDDYTGSRDYDHFYKETAVKPQEREQFIDWFVAFASKTSMSRGFIDTQSRQQWYLGLLDYMASTTTDEEVGSDFAEAAFDIDGLHEEMLVSGRIPPYFHNLVKCALQSPERTKWLREAVILHHWTLFMNGFLEKEFVFSNLSWVLCLDPVSLQQRILRADLTSSAASVDMLNPAFIVGRCCEIFAEGIRSGLAESMLVPLFHYLAVHDKKTLYQYIFKIKHRSELEPILGMDSTYTNRILGGDSITAKSARRQLHPIFLEWITEKQHGETEQRGLTHLGKLLRPDKGELLMQWLEAPELTAERNAGQQARVLAELLAVEWLGSFGRPPAEQHEQIERWLAVNSDWIKFDLDVPYSNKAAVKYRLVRPGYRDLYTGKVLARVLVRAELNDRKEILNLLDDLKNL